MWKIFAFGSSVRFFLGFWYFQVVCRLCQLLCPLQNRLRPRVPTSLQRLTRPGIRVKVVITQTLTVRHQRDRFKRVWDFAEDSPFLCFIFKILLLSFIDICAYHSEGYLYLLLLLFYSSLSPLPEPLSSSSSWSASAS